ncbi:MAG: hypothetical protein ACJA1C_000807 [Crocinitomicaceae bacterium]|jgi:hypothetical protein
MSVSIYCPAHIQGDNQQIEVAEIMNHLEPFVENKTPDGFDVVYDELNSSHVYIDTIDKTCSNFSINRPCGDERLYQAIYNCMQLGNVICYVS